MGFVIRLQSNANSRYPAILIYEDYVEKYQAMITGKRPDVFLFFVQKNRIFVQK